MKLLRLPSIIIALLLSSQLTFAGFDIPGSADGEDLGRPERPDPADPDKTLPADPIGAGTRNKMQTAMFAKYREIMKREFGTVRWNALTQPQKDQQISDRACPIYNDANGANGANAWQNLNDAQRESVLNRPGVRDYLQSLVILDLGCIDWDALEADEQERRLRERIAIAMIGQEAWDALSDAEKTAKRASAIDDKILIARCNLDTAIKFIACIPQPNPNPLGVPSGADVADCLRKTWEKRRICIDFISKGAFGSILPNCAGKAAGCDPDNNPINIALSTFPCKKTTDIYDPELYTLITTVYHEGIHALQAFSAKAARPGPGATQAERDAFEAAILARLNEMSQNECVTHGAENILIAALCPQVNNIIAENPVVDDGTNDFLTKVLECFENIKDDDARKDAARAFKAGLNDNKAVNDGALACYNQYKTIFGDAGLTDAQKRAQILQLRWIKARLNGRLAVAGGTEPVIQQWDTDPPTGDAVDRSTKVPMDIISDLIPVYGGSALLVVGSEFEFGDGIVMAYFDFDGDGFIDEDSGIEILRDFELFGPVDFIQDPTNGGILAVHLDNGNIFAFDEAPGFDNFDLLPDILNPVGILDLAPHDGFPQRAIITEDGSQIMALPGIEVGVPPVLLPGIPVPNSFFDPLEGGFLPQPAPSPYEFWLIPPVLVEANNLPVIDTTSVVNQFTNFLLLSGTPGGPFGLQIIPPLPEPAIPLPPQTFQPDGRAFVELPVPLEPGFRIELFVPSESPTNPLFSIIYTVRDATPRLLNLAFIPDRGFVTEVLGIPGMDYQLFFSPDLIQPFEPIGPPFFGGELPLPLPPVLPPDPFDPQKGFFSAQPLPDF